MNPNGSGCSLGWRVWLRNVTSRSRVILRLVIPFTPEGISSEPHVARPVSLHCSTRGSAQNNTAAQLASNWHQKYTKAELTEETRHLAGKEKGITSHDLQEKWLTHSLDSDSLISHATASHLFFFNCRNCFKMEKQSSRKRRIPVPIHTLQSVFVSERRSSFGLFAFFRVESLPLRSWIFPKFNKSPINLHIQVHTEITSMYCNVQRPGY